MGRKSKAWHAEQAAKKANEAARAVVTGDLPKENKDPEATPVISTPDKNPRNQLMDMIIESRGQTEPAPVETQEAPPVEPKPEVVAEVKDDTVSGGQDTVSGATEPVMIKVKVDGEEIEVPKEDVDAAGGVRAYQRELASENRLREAREALAEARQLKAELQAKPKEPEVSDDQFVASKMEAIRFGSEGEAAAALNAIIQRSKSKETSPDHVINLALIQVRRQAALDKFGEEFSDVVSNPVLGKLAVTLEREEMGKLPKNGLSDPAFVGKFDWNKFYRSIGNQIRGAVGRPSQATTPTATTGSTSQPSAKEERKASIVNLPTATAKAELPKEEKTETREDVLREMRKSRGQLT